eukprot:GDKI01018192.1.p1 GENE.GDKI01018192.1~~GDKI01018192.1.p1  ORF type:complete len:485 (-),score=132.42 GDKI01018192.1:300-1613(-)
MGDEYNHIPDIPDKEGGVNGATANGEGVGGDVDMQEAGKAKVASSALGKMIDGIAKESRDQPTAADSLQLSLYQQQNQLANLPNSAASSAAAPGLNQLAIRKGPTIPKPKWHAPWKLMRVISGHQGWVRCLAVDPSNEWFASAGNDRLIKIWDLASGTLKLTLTGHINTIRGLAISNRHPYLFSCGEDNMVKCWDLEYNKVIRSYHGHLSGVYCIALHPAIDVLATGGRDSAVRLWDMRTKTQIHCLSGHQGTVMSLISQKAEPQLVSGSMDHQVRVWDLAAGKCQTVLTHHKKSVRAMAFHPSEYTFATCASDNIKVWKCPEARFDRNISGNAAIVNCCAIRDEPESGSLVCGTDNGQLNFWDWRSGYKYQTIQSKVQPGSMESENGIFSCVFDQSQSRLITAECDKTIKVWKEDETATPETHPIDWKPPRDLKRF